MKQHMLTHKIRDMFGSSGGNSGDESRTQTPPQDSSNAGSAGGGPNSMATSNRFSQSYSPAPMDSSADDYSASGRRKRERSQSGSYDGSGRTSAVLVKQERESTIDENGSNSLHSNASENTSNNNYQEFINKDADIKNWCQKLKEMPENIAAS